ncbi:MAG TPA: hypothetical protein V6C81_02045 [Planktothrix sp.]|jgi:hypothetical protein
MPLGELVIILAGVATAAFTIYVAATSKGSGIYLCQDCKFNNPVDCLKPERPHATICTSYRTKN